MDNPPIDKPTSHELPPGITISPSDARICRNCGTPLMGAYCSHCGQSADSTIPSVPSLLAEFIDSLYNLDSRIWRTLARLTLRPGHLTVDYLTGKRASYIAPFRLYLILSLIFFVLDSTLADNDDIGVLGDVPDIIETPGAEDAAAAELAETCRSGLSFLDADGALYQAALATCLRVTTDPQALLLAFADRVPLLTFLLIPLMALFLKTFYAASARLYVEHLIYLFHVQAFCFFAAIISLLAAQLSPVPVLSTPITLLLAALWIYVVYYIYRAQYVVYGESQIATALKYALLLIAYLVALTLTISGGLVYFTLTL